MPLHAITALHGEDALRKRLAVEAVEFSDADQLRIAAALNLSSRLHHSGWRIPTCR